MKATFVAILSCIALSTSASAANGFLYDCAPVSGTFPHGDHLHITLETREALLDGFKGAPAPYTPKRENPLYVRYEGFNGYDSEGYYIELLVAKTLIDAKSWQPKGARSGYIILRASGEAFFNTRYLCERVTN